MIRKPKFLLVLLSIYVVLQFLWWGFLLIRHSGAKPEMILGEGLFFIIVLLIGIWRLGASIQKELQLSQRQNNFLLTITHELKTPISSIQLILQTLKKRDISDDQKSKFLNAALEENKRSEFMIDNILQAARIESKQLTAHKEKLNWTVFLQKLVNEYKQLFPNWNISTEGPEEALINADPFLFESAVRNLMENAEKYGGDHLHVKTQIKPQKIEISFADIGPGISEKERILVFEKFYRAGNENTRLKKGSGLGLYISNEFILLHGGTITIQSNEPHGSIFTITLPL